MRRIWRVLRERVSGAGISVALGMTGVQGIQRLLGLQARLPDYVRAVRRAADMSQRELAIASHVNKNTIASLESERIMDPRLSTLERIVTVAGWFVVFADERGQIVEPYPGRRTLDVAGRELPAHLDAVERPKAESWWQRDGGHTFIRDRAARDEWRREQGEGRLF